MLEFAWVFWCFNYFLLLLFELHIKLERFYIHFVDDAYYRMVNITVNDVLILRPVRWSKRVQNSVSKTHLNILYFTIYLNASFSFFYFSISLLLLIKH